MTWCLHCAAMPNGPATHIEQTERGQRLAHYSSLPSPSARRPPSPTCSRLIFSRASLTRLALTRLPLPCRSCHQGGWASRPLNRCGMLRLDFAFADFAAVVGGKPPMTYPFGDAD